MALWLVVVSIWMYIYCCQGIDTKIPCVHNEEGKRLPDACTQRILECRELSVEEKQTYIVIEPDTNTNCWRIPDGQRLRDTISTNKQRNLYYVKFDDANGKCYGIFMFGGECWGDQPITGENYNCMGRCGPGCGGAIKCSNWARNCLSHDVCSWYFSARGGPIHKHCGDEFNYAKEDWARCCVNKLCTAACSGKQNTCSWHDVPVKARGDMSRGDGFRENGWFSWLNPWRTRSFSSLNTKRSDTNVLMDSEQTAIRIASLYIMLLIAMMIICGMTGLIIGYIVSKSIK